MESSRNLRLQTAPVMSVCGVESKELLTDSKSDFSVTSSLNYMYIYATCVRKASVNWN